MKNRKQKSPAVRRPVLHHQQSFSQLKNPSGHTKMSTSGTTQSRVNHLSSASKPKSKKTIPGHKSSGPPQSSSSAPHSKTQRKAFPLSTPLLQDHEESQEYCWVDGVFVAMVKQDQKILEEKLAKTASTSCDFDGFGLSQHGKSKLRRRSIRHDSSQTWQEVEKCQIGIGTTKREKSIKQEQVQAKVQLCQIGLQYSERPPTSQRIIKNTQEKIVSQEKIIPEETEKQQEKQVVSQVKEAESLSDLLFRLQFTHLGDDKQFTHLSSHEKQHFSQLLTSLLGKLSPSLQKPQQSLKPISFQPLQDAPVEPLSSSSPRSPISCLETLPSELLQEQTQQVICLREYRQLSIIEDTFPYEEEGQVNTSLVGVLNFLGHLFCYLEVHYCEEFVYMIRKMYGFTFREKYRRITRNLPMGGQNKFRVVDETIFQEFINQNSTEACQHNYNELLHLKAIFDAFNEHLQEYRPYYLGNGQQFPWAFKMFTTMSEYSIDQDSLQIIFRQSKDKIVEWITLLCGLIVEVDPKQPKLNQKMVEAKHTQKQNKLIQSWMEEQNFQQDQIQLQGTKALHEVGQQIYAQLIQECLMEMDGIFN